MDIKTNLMKHTKKYYIATISVAVEAKSKDEAADTLTACLKENLKRNNDILFWYYTKMIKKKQS